MKVKTQLLLGISFGLAMAGTAYAQDTTSVDENADNDIIVTGIRGSLSSAASIKRNSNSIVDAISSEDLGKFPDSNIAESLQRIPGVAIDRSGGEGRFVTVRGFGPAFNTVLVNGRTFASDNPGREFSFDLLAAELISGAEVYKSAQASLQDGGIGATVNVKTPRPLDLNGFKAIFSAKALYEKNSKDVTPQAFGLISQTFADGTFGILASVSYQKRKSEVRFTQNRGYLPGTDVGPANAPLFTNVFAPRNQDVGQDFQDRERIGFNATAQYRPNDDLTITVDGLYNQFDVDSRVQSLGSWFEPSQYTDAEVDENGTITSLTTNGNADFIQTSNNRYVKTRAVGGNVEWVANDNLKVNLDVSWSRATDNAGGRNYFTVIGIPTQYSFEEATGSGFPSVFGYGPNITNPDAARAHIALRNGNDEAERVLEYKFDTEWTADSGALTKVRFGLVHTNRKKSSQLIATDPNIQCFYCGYSETIDANAVSLRPFNLGSFLGGSGNVPTSFFAYDPQAYFAYLESAAAASQRDANRRDGNGNLIFQPGDTAAALAAAGGYAAVLQPSSFSVSEKIYAGYLDTDFEGTIGNMPWVINIGARYVHTQFTANGLQQELVDLRVIQDDPTLFNGEFANGGRQSPVSGSSSYDVFLPNLNIKVNLTDNFVARLSASRTATRPQLRDLAPRTVFGTLRPATLDGSGGNPNLKPYRSDNFDISLEWYPNQNTTLSVAAFYKNIDDFIVQLRSEEDFTIVNADNIPVNNVITGPNTATFLIRRPQNAGDANVRGLELNAVHTFDYLPGLLSGFGVTANATFVSTNADFDVNSFDQSFAIEGLGDSYNASLFYEKHGLSARIAWNRRGRFLEHLVTPGQGGDPVFRRGFSQFDMRASYDILDNAQIFVEGTNIFNDDNITTGRYDNQVLDYVDTGARWAAGVRFNF